MATFAFRIRNTVNKQVTIVLRFSNGRNTNIEIKSGFEINPNEWNKSAGMPLKDSDNELLRLNLIKLETFLLKSFNKAQSKGIIMDKDWLKSKTDECFKRNKKISMENKTENNGWIKIENEDWLKEKKITGSTTRLYVNNPEEDYLTIAVIVKLENETQIMTLSDYLFLKYDTDITATHYQPIEIPEPPIY